MRTCCEMPQASPSRQLRKLSGTCTTAWRGRDAAPWMCSTPPTGWQNQAWRTGSWLACAGRPRRDWSRSLRWGCGAGRTWTRSLLSKPQARCRAALDARRGDCGPWARLDGIKFYADGWLVPRTCALCQDFADTAGNGVLFADAPALARRIQPLAERGWRIATHAIGDRAVAAVLDAYDLAFDGDTQAMAAAAPRIEHASVLPAELIARMASSGVVACIQPSFALTDADELEPALGAERAARAYPWTELARGGVAMLAGTDYPIEVLDPLPGLARLVNGQSSRAGFMGGTAPAQARLAAGTAFALMSDPAAGQALLSADPRAMPAAEIDTIVVLGTLPASF